MSVSRAGLSYRYALLGPENKWNLYADLCVAIGACTHCFHMHCINDWLNSDASQGKCPMCRQVFTERKADAGVEAGASGSLAAAQAAETPRTPANAGGVPG